MLCPYCGGEMEKGYLRSPQEIAWLKGDKRHVFGRASFHPGSVVLSGLSFWKGSAVAAHLCRRCGKVIIDYADGKQDLNAR